MTDRFEFVLSHVAGAGTILNLGCTGHPWDAPYQLHDTICHHVGPQNVVGLDCDREAVSKMCRHNYNVWLGDVEHLNSIHLPNRKFGAIVAGELIEHLTNVQAFLNGCRRFLAPGNGKLILTTPNCWGFWSWLLYGVLQREEVHPEHVSAYCKDALYKTLKRHGWEVVEFQYLMQEQQSFRKRRWLKEIPERYFPGLKPILGCVAQLK